MTKNKQSSIIQEWVSKISFGKAKISLGSKTVLALGNKEFVIDSSKPLEQIHNLCENITRHSTTR